MPDTSNDLPSASAQSSGPQSTGNTACEPLALNQRLTSVPGSRHGGTLISVLRPSRESGLKNNRWLLQCLNTGVQPALVTRGFIFVHQAFSGHAVEHRNCSRVSRRCSFFVTRTNRCNNALNMCTHHRTHTSVAGSSCFCLTSTLFCLRGVRQLFLLEKLKIQPNSIVRALSVVNQNPGSVRADLAGTTG